MSVIGHLRRSALGAGGVALLLPLGLTLGVALTTALGGEATLRALGQVFAGPDAPQGARAPGLESARSVPPVPVGRPSRSPGAAPASPGPGGIPVPAASGDGDGSPPALSEPGDPGSGPPSGGRPPRPGGTPQAPPAEPPQVPEPAGSPVNQAGGAAAEAVGDVPVAGEPAGHAMQTVVDLIP